MPRLKLLATLLISIGSSSFAMEELYKDEEWLVGYDEELQPLRAGCLFATQQKEGRLAFYLLDDRLDAKLVRASDTDLTSTDEVSVLFQVDDGRSWEATSHQEKNIIRIKDIPYAIISDIASGHTIHIDLNADGRWDDDFSFVQADPALDALAQCVAKL
jgi:hypothetical protein